MGEWLPASEALHGGEELDEAEGEVEVADGVEAPDPPFEDDPEHHYGAADGSDGDEERECDQKLSHGNSWRLLSGWVCDISR